MTEEEEIDYLYYSLRMARGALNLGHYKKRDHVIKIIDKLTRLIKSHELFKGEGEQDLTNR